MTTSVVEPSEVAIAADEWLADNADLLSFDERIHHAEDHLLGAHHVHLMVDGDDASVARAQHQLSLRYQRLWPRRNDASRTPLFETILSRHRALHALEKPQIRADYDHAIDVWQWVLRLAPQAGFALQLAALFHDVERFMSNADARIEHDAPDYVAFEQAHARSGGAVLRRSLAGLSVAEEELAHAAALIERHVQPAQQAELATLNDAECLSFFALDCPGFSRYYGAEHTAHKVAYNLSRMSPAARCWLSTIRLERDLERMVRAAQAQQT